MCSLALPAIANPASGGGAGADLVPQVQVGEHVFKARCVVCHGAQADGKSELAKIMKPPPANLRASALTAEQKSTIVRKGGEAVGRSPNMPTWELELNEAELQAVLAYIGSIKQTEHTAMGGTQP
jgi:mono/diheme cytochrome c family protein